MKLGFPTGRDSTTFWDNGTEVSSLSRDKGTTEQAQNWESDFVPGRPGTEKFVPGFLLLPLSWDKGTLGQENFFVPSCGRGNAT